MKKYSKYMSFILRHNPAAGGITLDDDGYTGVEAILESLRENVGPITRIELEQLVRDNDKQRFAFSACGTKVRASQGHSVSVDLKLEQQVPPERLFHGTKRDFLNSIIAGGLTAQQRQHVHLSETLETAKMVAGRRKGESVILEVETAKCPEPFYLSENGVWLITAVPREALSIFVEKN